jgi:hypothetical protein
MIEKYTTEVPASSITSYSPPTKPVTTQELQKKFEDFFSTISANHLLAFREGNNYYKRNFNNLDLFLKNTFSFFADEFKKNATNEQKNSIDECHKILISVAEILKSLDLKIDSSICLSSFVGYIINGVRKTYEENKNK